MALVCLKHSCFDTVLLICNNNILAHCCSHYVREQPHVKHLSVPGRVEHISLFRKNLGYSIALANNDPLMFIVCVKQYKISSEFVTPQKTVLLTTQTNLNDKKVKILKK